MLDNNKLNDRYRERGWGKITDQALGIDPVDVEAQARDVASWAYAEITRLKSQIALHVELAAGQSKLIDELLKRLPEKQEEIV